ncbi:MAG TPA: maltose alpha-D-glucosyltransferase [Polyangiales bacterium]|nr:maltose alpha-D-glucosyltransferase [Polyangiales bacterium]
MMRPTSPRNGLTPDPHWYKDAVFYECRTRSFFDSNGDGIGDLAGLTQKLPYLQDLGVTALWLLPLCPSPMRDDGYDIADYYDVDPDVGTREDFRQFVQEAHRYGIRVITELVLNHTSDAHPWFQRARRAPPGSPERNFYVWTDSPERYPDARIIFKDFEPSNWSWDRLANAYYWHRFFSHQPDLNFENPAVQEALFAVVDFWFEMGVDGLRLDAVPYLYEAEGTNCENLPATHVFLKRLRAHVDSKFANRMLLAEANQWPEDAAAYFGDGDECHMNFHFPIMPRMFMAIHMEDRFPIVDIMAQTPQLHSNCQWAMFLRNHDELTLEMVTDEERDYMYRAYAHEPAMRINLGIRRRLAPLVGNDRRKMELLNGLLFSLPGTPVLYYGDEIGMGDNVFLGDRNGVRTPMQWSSDRNAGFSRANPQRLILPVIIDPEYHFESLNVEAQQNNPNSLLWWTKRLISLRKRFRAFGWGSIEFLAPSNARVLAFIREYDNERILVVANLSRFVQYVELDLSKYKGMIPIELFGKNPFPEIGELPYLLTLGGHSFYWCSLENAPSHEETARASLFEPPRLAASSFQSLCSGEDRGLLEEILPEYLQTRSWFRGRLRSVGRVYIQSAQPLSSQRDGTWVVFVRVEYTEGEPETYLLPLKWIPDIGDVKVKLPLSILASLELPHGQGKLVDSVEETDASRPVLEAIMNRARFGTPGDEIVATSVLEEPEREPTGEPRSISVLRANAALQFGERYFLKVFRRLEEGVSPDLEVGRFLAARAPGLTPPVLGALEHRVGRGEPRTLAVLQGYVSNEGTAWSHTRRELGRFYERVLTLPRDEPAPELPHDSLIALSAMEPPPLLREVLGVYQQHAALLGKRTAEMHLALVSGTDLPAFAPQHYSALDRRSSYQSRRNLVGRVMRTLRAKARELPASCALLTRAVLDHERELLGRFEPLLHNTIDALRIRVHGDYHLEQALWTGKDFVIIDFDGGHDSALSERRRKRSALRDVAGMIRSFHYAAYTGLFEGIVREADRARAQPWADLWHNWISAVFVRSYRETAGNAAFLPSRVEDLDKLLDMSILAKAVRELGHELVVPNDHVTIPLHAIAEMLGVLPPPRT